MTFGAESNEAAAHAMLDRYVAAGGTFIDTADVDQIREAYNWGIVDGVTTNPSLVAKVAEGDVTDMYREICEAVAGPVTVGEGRMDNSLVDLIVADVLVKLLEALNPFRKEDPPLGGYSIGI